MRWDKVASGSRSPAELLDRESVEWHVVVEGLDHPIAPAPHIARTVVLVAVSVRVAGGFQPAERHPLAEARRGQQALDRRSVGRWRLVRQELPDFLGGRRQAGQVERHPPQ